MVFFIHTVFCFFAFCFSAGACVAVFTSSGLKRTPDKVIISWLETYYQREGSFKPEIPEALKARIQKGASRWREKQGGQLIRLLKQRLKKTEKVVHVLLNHDWSMDYETIKDNIEHYDEVASPFHTNELLAISLDFNISLAMYADQYRSRKFAAASAVMEHINPFLNQRPSSPDQRDIFQKIYNKTHLVFWTPRDVHNLLNQAQKHLVEKEDLVALVEGHSFSPHIYQLPQREKNFYEGHLSSFAFLFGSRATEQFVTNHRRTASDIFMGFLKNHYRQQGDLVPLPLMHKVQKHTAGWTYKEARGFLISINRRFSRQEVIDQIENSDVLARGYEQYKQSLPLRVFTPSKKPGLLNRPTPEEVKAATRLSPGEFQKEFPHMEFSHMPHLKLEDVRTVVGRYPPYSLAQIRKLSLKDPSLRRRFGPLLFLPSGWVAFLKPSFLLELKRSVTLLADALSDMTEEQKNTLSRDQKRRIRKRLVADRLWSEIRILDQIPHKKPGRKPLAPPPTPSQKEDYADLMEAFLLRQTPDDNKSPSRLKEGQEAW